MFAKVSYFFVKVMNRYSPSPFAFCVLLTLAMMGFSLILTDQSLGQVGEAWGKGLWSLLGFSMQMALILVTGHTLAKAPVIGRTLDRLAGGIKTPKSAIFAVTLVALIGCWFNWGFGLIAGAVFAKALARQVKGVDYPLLVASAYSGFLIWHGGLSGSIPLALATEGADLVKLSGQTITNAVPISQTLFSPLNLTIVAGLLVGLPVLNMLMLPKSPHIADPAKLMEALPELPPTNTPAQKIDDSRLLALGLLAMGAVYLYGHFSANGANLALNVVIGLFLFLGIALHGTLERYNRAVEDAVKGIAGIVLLFPFYGGIMGLMMGADAQGVSLGSLVSHAFVSVANRDSFAVLAFLSAGLVNVFVPSGGGQWAVQGPIVLPAGVALGVAPEVSAMAIAWGDAWTNMIQPFWALPLLGIAGLDARAIMGYCLMALIYSGVLICGVFWIFA